VPLPDWPISLAPAIAVVYLLLGAAVLFGRNLRAGRREWMASAGYLPEVAESTTAAGVEPARKVWS
jgi:hypothetical protein